MNDKDFLKVINSSRKKIRREEKRIYKLLTEYTPELASKGIEERREGVVSWLCNSLDINDADVTEEDGEDIKDDGIFYKPYRISIRTYNNDESVVVAQLKKIFHDYDIEEEGYETHTDQEYYYCYELTPKK